MGVDLTSSGGYRAVLRNVYLPGLNEQLRLETPLLNLIENISDTEELVGDNIYLDCHIARTSGMRMYGGATQLESAVDIPAGGTSKLTKMTIPLVYMIGSIAVDHQAIKRMKSRGTNARVLPWLMEMQDIRKQFRAILQKVYMGTGSGSLAVIASVTHAGDPSIVTVDTTRNLQEGMVVDWIQGSSGSEGTAISAALTIIGIVSATEFSYDDGGSAESVVNADNDYIVLKDSFDKGPKGLAHIVDNVSTSFQNINRTTNYWAQAVVHENAGSAADFVPKQLAIAMAKVKGRHGEVEFLLMTTLMKDGVIWHTYGDRRFPVMREKVEIFDSGFTVYGKPIMIDEDTTPQTIYGLNASRLVRGQIGGLVDEYRDPEGGNAIRTGLNSNTSTAQQYQTTWEMSFEHWGNLAARDCQDFFKLTNVFDLSEGTYA